MPDVFDQATEDVFDTAARDVFDQVDSDSFEAQASQGEDPAVLDDIENERRMGAIVGREQPLLERLRQSPAAVRLLGPPAWQVAAAAAEGVDAPRPGGQPAPVELARTMLQATTVPQQALDPLRVAREAVIGGAPAPVQGVVRGATEFAAGLSPALPIGGRAFTGAIAADMAGQVSELKREFDAAVEEGDTARAWELGTAGVLTPALAAGAAAHAARPGPARPKQPTAPDPYANLEAPFPDPDLVARNLAAPGTRRPTERQVLGLPDVELPPDSVRVQRVPLINNAGQVVDVQVRRVPIREIVIEEGGPPRITPVERGAVREDVQGGRVSFAAEAPTLQREALTPREEAQVAERLTQLRDAMVKESLAVEPSMTSPETPTSSGSPESTKPSQTITGSKVQTGTEMPVRPEASPPAGEATVVPERFRPNISQPEIPPDVLAEIQRQRTGSGPLTDAEKTELRELRFIEEYRGSLGLLNTARLEHLASREMATTPAPAEGAKAKPSAKSPAQMTASEINKRLDRLGTDSSRLTDEFIAAGRGNERPTDYATKTDPLSTRMRAVADEIAALRLEIEARYGPGAPSRLPSRGFGPREKPGMVAGTKAEEWADRTIAEGRKRLNTGIDPELMAAYVVKGAAHLERGVRKFSDWAARMVAEYGDAVRPHLRRIWDESQRVAASPKASMPPDPKRSKFAARASVAPEVAPADRTRMAGDAGLYQPQRMDDVTTAVRSMSNDELRAVPPLTEAGPNNAWVAAKLELYHRLKNANSEEAWGHLLEARQQLTTFGQLVNQAKLLTSATPEGMVAMIEAERTSKKLPPLPPGTKAEMVVLADHVLETQRKAEAAERDYVTRPTEENVARVEQAHTEADTATRRLEVRKQQTEPRLLSDTLVQVMQGNVLTPLSQAANVGGNLFSAITRGSERAGALLADIAWNRITGQPRDISMNPAKSWPRQLEEMKRSWADMRRVWRSGASDLEPSKLDVRRNLHPLLALREIKTGQWKGKPAAEKVAMALEASPFAMHAAAQLRTLGAFDLPVRRAARARLITEAMNVRRLRARSELTALQRLPSPDLAARVRMAGLRRFLTDPDRTAHAIRLPSRYFTPEELARIDLESQRVTFQEPNPVAQFVLSGVRKMPAPLRTFLRANALFITTPLNIIKQVYQFNPAVAGAEFARHAAKGRTREAKLAFGRMLTGSLIAGTGYLLARDGILSPPLDDETEQQKGRLLSTATMPPNTVNLSALQRRLAGASPEWQAGDRLMDISKLGTMGILMQQAAHVSRRQERNPIAKNPTAFLGDLLTETTLGAAQYGLQQSFLRNMESVLSAISSGQDNALDSWAQAFTETALSVPFPNTLTAWSRASRDWKPDVRGDSMAERLDKLIKNRLDAVSPGPADLPLRRGIWGEPIPETPPGALPYLHQFLDVSRSQQVPQDPVNLTLYTLWRRTADAGVIPTPPGRRFVAEGQTYDLTREQASRLQELVGKARRSLADEVVTSPEFLRMDFEDKLAELQDLWREGAEEGRAQFLEEREGELTRKARPAALPAVARP